MSKSPLIVGRNIVRRFGSGELEVTVLKGIDITVYEGEFLAIMGKSGAGKSTLMYQLAVLDTPSAGELTVAGVDVLTLTESAKTNFRLNTLGYVFQNYALVPDLSTLENVSLPLIMRGLSPNEAEKVAQATLESVGLTNKGNNFPAQLSGGEQQRVSIARAVAGQPKIIFADEPTANLDSTAGQAVVDLLTNLHRQGQTIVMVTHEPEYATHCERLIRMSDGIITETITK